MSAPMEGSTVNGAFTAITSCVLDVLALPEQPARAAPATARSASERRGRRFIPEGEDSEGAANTRPPRIVGRLAEEGSSRGLVRHVQLVPVVVVVGVGHVEEPGVVHRDVDEVGEGSIL